MYYQHTSYYFIITIIYYSSSQFILFCSFFPHTSLLIADANVMYHPSFIIYYSSTHYLFNYFLINPLFFPPWMVDANFIFMLVFVSSYFCFILCMRHGLFFILVFKLFIYNMLPLLYTFLSCSSHIVNTFYLVFFFLKFLHPEFVSYVTML